MTCHSEQMIKMADEGKEKDDNNDHILYNLLVYAEWNLEGEVLNKDSLDILQKKGSLGRKFLSIIEGSVWNFWKLVKYPFSNLANPYGLPEEIAKLNESLHIWDLALSSNGDYLAVLQDQYIEIRSYRDNFSNVLSRCQITKDPSPKWRKLSWSNDASLLAFGYSSGEVVVFDLSGTALCGFKGNITSNMYSGGPFRHNKAIAGLIFTKHTDQTESSSMELLVITYQGYLTSYIINGSNGEHKKIHTFSFQSVLPCGVSSVIHYPSSNLLILGSPGVCGNHGKSAIGNGITLWRILSDYPHYKLIEDQVLELKKAQQQAGLLGKILPSRSGNKQNGVWKMSLSHDGSALLVLHYSGRLSLWEVPSLKLRKSWDRADQPEYKNEDHLQFPSFNSKKHKGRGENFLYDISWWSNEAVVLAQSCGAVTVSTVKNSLQNILGQYAEWCEPFPLVTTAHNGGFLILECENTVVSSTHARKNVVDEGGKEEHEDDEDDDQHMITKAKELTKHLLYFLTESERFQPPIRRPKILKQIYRLLSLRSTTPEELYARKIELEEYGEALALAQSYGLDCDLVYQKQWRKSKVNVSSIHDYLSKVTKRIWVLHECLERVPEDLDSTKALLKYGLHGTGLQVLTVIGEKNAEHPFLNDECDGDGDEERQSGGDDERKLLRNIDFKNLSVEQRNICRYRLRFLKYLDRLSTYEAILGGPAMAHDAFDSGFFTAFRDSNIVETAADFARDNDWDAVDCLLTYHGKETLPHYLAILSNFPETTTPFDYRSLLPEAGVKSGEPEIYEWEQKSWRSKDWVEDLTLTFVEREVDSGEFLYVENVELEKFSNIQNSQLLTEWYKYRAHEIESSSSQVDNALELIKLGKERGVKGLVSLHDDLVTLSDIVYENRGEGHVDLKSFQKLTNLEKMKLLLSKSSEQTFIENFKKWVIPFLERVERRSKGSKLKLIQLYMTETAKTDLTYPQKILEQSSSEATLPFIPDVAQQMKLAIDCIYLCSRDDQLDQASSMLKCFTKEKDGILSGQIVELHTKIEDVETHLEGARILSRNGFPKPVSFLLDSKANKEIAACVMDSLSKLARNKQPPLKKSEWTKLLGDLLSLRDQIFHCISRTVCYQACAQSLLGSGSKEIINHSKQLLCCNSEPSPDKVPYAQSVEMVVNAAREYFNSANDVTDPCMKLAKTCLELISSNEASVKEELDFITALSMLAEFNVSILPLQVRLCQDKAELIEKALDASPSSYKDPGKLLHLASLVQLSGTDEKTRRGRVLSLVAQRALENSDFNVAYHACAELMKTGFIPGWKICRTLGENTDFTNLKARRKLLDFSLIHCEPNAIETLFNTRSLLQTEILYSEISELMAEIEEPVFSDDISTTDQISKTTKTIISSVSDFGWWKNTLQWMRPLHRVATEDKQTNVEEEIVLNFCCHPFYDTLHSKQQQVSKRGYKIDSEKGEGSSLRISELLLQTQKLAEERADGSIEEPGTEVLLQLADECFNKDSSLSLAYLLALPEFNNAYECFEKLPSCSLTLQFATYYYALQVYNELNPCAQQERSLVYLHHPADVVDHVIHSSCAAAEIGDDVKFLLVHLKRYHTQLADFSQAKLLQKLGRGVDIARFTQDEEYKHETILGLTMSVEDDIFNTAISLAERYKISKWEMFMSHLEWLFTDSELTTKQLQDRVNDKQIMTTLLDKPKEVINRLKEYIYPAIDGKQLARLLYYYMLFNECVQKGETIFEGDSDPQMHIRLIKKIKAASPGVDYKKLMDGDDPLQALQPHLIATNVHVFAKMANKLRSKDGLPLTPSKIFKTFASKIFWEGERKTTGKDVDWIHRYEVVHGYLDRLTYQDIIDLIDSLTFSEIAIDTLTLDLRDDITRRALKFSRQMVGKQRKKSKEDNIVETNVSVNELCEHFEQSLKHIASLNHEVLMKLSDADESRHLEYTRLYDLSRSEPQKVKELCVQILCCGDGLEMAKDVLDLGNQQCAHGWKVKDILKEAFRILLRTYSHPDERPEYLPSDVSVLDLLDRLLVNSRQYMKQPSTKNIIKDEDILQEIRPFCADETVPPEIKPVVLELLEQFITLSGEDRIMLLYYQTNAIVSDTWDIKLKIEHVETEERRHELFVRLFHQNINHKQMLSTASLLEIWPSFEKNRGDERAWYLVLLKLIKDAQDCVSVVKIIQDKKDHIELEKKDCQRLFEALLQTDDVLSSFKFGLLVGDEEMFQFIINQLKHLQPYQTTCDNELLELFYKRRLSSQIVHTPFFSVYVTYLLQQGVDHSRESRVNEVIRDLHEAGHTLEAASMRTSLENTHPALRTLDTALGSFLRWMTDR